MKNRLTLLLLSLAFSFAAINVNAHHEPATNKDGSVVTGVLTASFDPFGKQSRWRAVSPFPSNLGFFALDAAGNLLPPADLTLNLRWMTPTIIGTREWRSMHWTDSARQKSGLSVLQITHGFCTPYDNADTRLD